MADPLLSRHITDSRELAERARPPRNKPGVRRLFVTTYLRRPLPEVYAFFCDAHNLAAITPPELEFQILSPQEAGTDDPDLLDYRLKVRGVPLRWRTRILRRAPNAGFVDEQARGPFSLWHHTHTFTDEGDRVRMDDEVIYRLPLWPLGDIAAPWVKRELDRLFEFRTRRIREIFGE